MRSLFVVLAELQGKLEELVEALAPLRALMSPLSRDGGAPFPARRRRKKEEAATTDTSSPPLLARRPNARHAQVLQGKYMASMRGLSPADKDAVRAVRAKQGVAAAITAAAERKPL